MVHLKKFENRQITKEDAHFPADKLMDEIVEYNWNIYQILILSNIIEKGALSRGSKIYMGENGYGIMRVGGSVISIGPESTFFHKNVIHDQGVAFFYNDSPIDEIINVIIVDYFDHPG